jgi:hypothetical protein
MPLVGLICASAVLCSLTTARGNFAPDTNVAIHISCPDEATSDPNFSFTATNLGSEDVVVSGQEPISVMVRLTVLDSMGHVVQPGVYDSGSRSISTPRILAPGKSLVLEDWIRHDQPRTPIIPLRAFGYTLTPGSYDVSAKAFSTTDEPTSNVCHIKII